MAGHRKQRQRSLPASDRAIRAKRDQRPFAADPTQKATCSRVVIVIDDDPRLAKLIADYLRDEGFAVQVAHDGETGLRVLDRDPIDAIILDIGLPGMDGLEVCRRVRAVRATPILMLTAKGEAIDRVIGLEVGADDYLPKPFDARELLARIRAILRRSHGKPNSVLRFGGLEIDRDAMEVNLHGRRCGLTSYQFQLLSILAESAGRVLSRDFLMQRLQGTNAQAFDRSIDVHVSRIRAEIEDDPKQPRRVITVRGGGYVFAKSQD